MLAAAMEHAERFPGLDPRPVDLARLAALDIDAARVALARLVLGGWLRRVASRYRLTLAAAAARHTRATLALLRSCEDLRCEHPDPAQLRAIRLEARRVLAAMRRDLRPYAGPREAAAHNS